MARRSPCLTSRRLGRVGLAVACGLAGLAYGALLDLSVMVTYGGEQSLDRYLALSARGIPFNVAHAAGNIALALAAGPALVRMISRYREPVRVHLARSAAAARAAGRRVRLAGVAVARRSPRGALAAAARPAPGPPAARHWLERAQNPDGGFGASPDAASSAAITGWAVLGLEAPGATRSTFGAAGTRPIDYLRSQAGRPALDRRPGADHPGRSRGRG